MYKDIAVRSNTTKTRYVAQCNSEFVDLELFACLLTNACLHHASANVKAAKCTNLIFVIVHSNASWLT